MDPDLEGVVTEHPLRGDGRFVASSSRYCYLQKSETPGHGFKQHRRQHACHRSNPLTVGRSGLRLAGTALRIQYWLSRQSQRVEAWLGGGIPAPELTAEFT